MGGVEKSLEDSDLRLTKASSSKCYITALHQTLCDEILQSILESPVIHIDETTVRLRKQKQIVAHPRQPRNLSKTSSKKAKCAMCGL
jgi:hypothetical protein